MRLETMGLDIYSTWERRCQETGIWINMEDEVRIPVLEARGRELWDHLLELGGDLDLLPQWNRSSAKTLDLVGAKPVLVAPLAQLESHFPPLDTFGYQQYAGAVDLMRWVQWYYGLHRWDVRLIYWGEC